MCGIFGYIGNQKATLVCLDGLKKLEYRGYDSAGIAGVDNNQILVCKELGKISALENAVQNRDFQFKSAIAHTRWATHGKPSKENAHPHLDQKKSVAVVHNGVIENYATIKDDLIQKQHVIFSSETDTEVIPHLIASYYKGDLLHASMEAFKLLEGSFALAIIHKDHPDQIVAVAEQSPLIVGYSPKTQESFLASDPNALPSRDLDIYYLVDGEVALLDKGKVPSFFDKEGRSITKKGQHPFVTESETSKGKFEHFMLKEIFEQALTVRSAMKGRYQEERKSVYFEEFAFDPSELKTINQIVLVACGTSYYAAMIAAYLLESIAGISAKAEIASEYRYKNPVLLPNTLVIALSQSGETADTIAAVRNVKGQAARTLALCNVPGSSLTREVDTTIYLHAGSEIAVASTKTFTSQVIVLYLLTLLLAQQRNLNPVTATLMFKRLYDLPIHVEQVLSNASEIEKLAKKYAHYEDFFFLGRSTLYPTALEAALKLKEIAYVDAQGYPAGEMKHGPIALLCDKVPAVLFCANSQLQQKIMSNLMECKARGAPIVVFGWKQFEKEIAAVADDVLWIPKTSDELACIPLTIASQFFAYYIARERGADIDKPRNLAKSVTVE